MLKFSNKTVKLHFYTFTLNRWSYFCIEYSSHVSERKCDPNCCVILLLCIILSTFYVQTLGAYACIGKEMYYIIIVFLIGYITLSEYTTTNLYLWQQVLSGTTCWNEILLYYVHHMSIQIKISLNYILESGIISFLHPLSSRKINKLKMKTIGSKGFNLLKHVIIGFCLTLIKHSQFKK